MFETLKNIFKKSKIKELSNSKDAAKERLHLVLMQDRANVSADFLDLMRAEIVEVIKKYIDIDEKAMDVRLTTETNPDGTQGGPALYANIPIINIKEETRKLSKVNQDEKIISQPPKNVKTDVQEENSNSDKELEENIDEKDEKNKKENNNNATNKKKIKNIEGKKDNNVETKNEEKKEQTVDVVVSNNDEIKYEKNADDNKTESNKADVKKDDIKDNKEEDKIDIKIEDNKEKEDIEKKDDNINKENKTNNSNENKEEIKEKKDEK